MSTRSKSRWLVPKGNLSKLEVRLLVLLALLPFASIALRALALPGVTAPAFDVDFLRAAGNALNQLFSLSAVPVEQRDHVLYLLFLPLCALLVTLARLTFGIRVLGFRSILLAVGFHQSGIVPSLVLIGVVTLTIVSVRPWLRRIRLPYYARVSVILCIVAMTMVGWLLLGPWLQLDILWGLIYFPVIVLGMLAEGIAHTLDRDNAITATWRAGTTIALAFVMSLICQIPALRAAMLQFPELALTQIVAIVMVAEFFDFRLFQDWDTKAAGVAYPSLVTNDGHYRVAVVRNHLTTGVIGRLRRRDARKHTVRSSQQVAEALRAAGHTVRIVEGDVFLLRELRQFLPANPRSGEPGGIVFNLARGIQGESRMTHVPAMLEMAGVAYTGATPLGYALTTDKFAAKTLMVQAGIPTPAFCLMARASDDASALQYPLILRPRHRAGAAPRVVGDRTQLEETVRAMVRRYRQEVLVEEYVAGRRIHVALLGNHPLECLPLLESTSDSLRRVRRPRLAEDLVEEIRERAKAVFWATKCRDYARVDFRIVERGDPVVIDVVTAGLFATKGLFVRAAAEAGLSYPELVCRIIEIARKRYLDGEKARPAIARRSREVDSLLRQGPR